MTFKTISIGFKCTSMSVISGCDVICDCFPLFDFAFSPHRRVVIVKEYKVKNQKSQITKLMPHSVMECLSRIHNICHGPLGVPLNINCQIEDS